MQRIGRYELGRVLGRGGAGMVYEAELIGPGGFRKDVALKLLHHGSSELRREARIGGLLRHRNLLDVYEIGEEGGLWFCAMERAGGPLADHAPLPPRAVVEVGLQVCAALGYGHRELGLVHLDIKPENLLFTADGVVKVADLGIARAEGFETEGIRGTPGYMAPEQARGAPVDGRADQYALGITLIELAMGTRLVASETMDWTADDDESWDTMSLDDLEETEAGPLPGVPEWLAPAVERCLQPDPADRWPDMAALADALRSLSVDGAGLGPHLGLPPAETHARLPSLLDEPDAFVGRQDELCRLSELLEAPGVISLVGPAGIGKSRLARAAARSWRDRTGEASWFCDLTEVSSINGLCGAVARILDVPLGRSTPVERVGQALAGRGPLVLVLDNFEQIVDLAAVVDRWADQAAEARFLITSRVALRLDGECVVEVRPLDDDAAVALLSARALQRGAVVEHDPLLSELARKLDRLPLALELAAGRLGVLSVEDVLENLSLGMLRAGADGRHGTLQAALEWSWGLLSPTEQSALTQLSAFSGGFTAIAAEEVLAIDAPVFDTLESLVTHSMAMARSDGRFDLLLSVQEFAASRAEDHTAWTRHGEHFARVARSPVGQTDGPELHQELDNLLAAQRRAIASSRVDLVAPLSAAIWRVMNLTGPMGEAVRVLEEGLAAAKEDDSARALLQGSLGAALRQAGEIEEAEHHLLAALDRFEALGQPQDQFWVQMNLGSLYMNLGQADRGMAHHRASLDLARALGDRAFEAKALGNIAALEDRMGHAVLARERYEASLALHEEVGARRSRAIVLSNLGLLDQREGHTSRALARFTQSLAIYRSLGDQSATGNVLGNIGNLHVALGEPETALPYYRESIALLRATGNRRVEGITLGGLGVLYQQLGQIEEARAHLLDSLAIQRELGNLRYEGGVLGVLGDLDREAGELGAARTRYELAESALREAKDPAMLAAVLVSRVHLDLAAGEVDHATERLAEAEALAKPLALSPEAYLAGRIAEARDDVETALRTR